MNQSSFICDPFNKHLDTMVRDAIKLRERPLFSNSRNLVALGSFLSYWEKLNLSHKKNTVNRALFGMKETEIESAETVKLCRYTAVG